MQVKYKKSSENYRKTKKRYTGIPTVRKIMKEAGLPEPEFINKRNEFVVILYNSETETVINNEADVVCSCVRKQKNIRPQCFAD